MRYPVGLLQSSRSHLIQIRSSAFLSPSHDRDEANPDLHSCPDGPAAVGTLALVNRLRPGRHLTATTQSIAWTGIFFIASCAATSAYLTVSEIFPLEIRGMAISLFYAIGTLVGGVGAPLLFRYLIGTGSRIAVFWGYGGSATLMVIAAAVELVIGVKAEGGVRLKASTRH